MITTLHSYLCSFPIWRTKYSNEFPTGDRCLINVLTRHPRRNFINLFGRSTPSVFTIFIRSWARQSKIPVCLHVDSWMGWSGQLDRPQTAISVHGGLEGRIRTVIFAYNEKTELDFQNFFSFESACLNLSIS